MSIHDIPQQSNETDATRTPPQAIDAEASTLGGMLLSRDAADEVAGILHAADFYRPAHEAIFAAIVNLHERGEPADAVTIADELDRIGQLTRCGGPAYLHTLISLVPTAANAGYYARIVLEKARKRRGITAGTRLVQAGWDPSVTAEEMDAIADREIRAATTRSVRAVPIGQMVDEAFAAMEDAAKLNGKFVGAPSGFADLDALLGGFKQGQLVYVAARPAIGKTTFGMDVARTCALQYGITAGIKSLEMSRGEIMQRVLSAEARVLLKSIRTGHLRDVDWEELQRFRPIVSRAPLVVDDTPEATIASVRAFARDLKRQDDRAVMIIDYLQLMSSGGRIESRQQEVSQISRGLKLLAKEYEMPVIALSQLNRGPEQRQDKKPQMSDLRESGSLEQDADIVILLHREDAYDKESPRAGEADFIVAKHRNGATDTITVAFQGHYSRFVDPGSEMRRRLA